MKIVLKILLTGAFLLPGGFTSAQIVVSAKVSIEQMLGEKFVLISRGFYQKVLEFEYYNPFKHVIRRRYDGFRIFEFKSGGNIEFEETTKEYYCSADLGKRLFFEKAHWESVDDHNVRLAFKGGMLAYPYEEAVLVYKTYTTKKGTFVFERIAIEKTEEWMFE